MPLWVTESGDVETRKVRPKVGTPEPVMESLVLLDLERHQRHDLDPGGLPGILEDPLADLRAARRAEAEAAAAEAGQESPPAAAPKPEPRPFGVLRAEWSGDGERVAVMLRSRDNKDRWIATIDLDTPALRALHHEHDPAWINYAFYDLGWLADHETLYYLSEVTGYSALYTQTVDSEPVLRVSGDFVDDLFGLVVLGRHHGFGRLLADLLQDGVGAPGIELRHIRTVRRRLLARFKRFGEAVENVAHF
jgi:hypothetical protein